MKTLTLRAALLCLPLSLFSQTGSIRIKISGAKAGAGNLEIAIFDNAKGFPSQFMNAPWSRVVTTPGPEVEVTFDNLAPGRYAVSVMQDLNGNGKLDTS